MGWPGRMTATLTFVLTASVSTSCAKKQVSDDLLPEQRTLRDWYRRAESDGRAHLESAQQRLQRDQLERPGDRQLIEVDKEAIRNGQSWSKQCGDIVRAEREIYSHNRMDPTHPEAQVSDFRRYLCGGP